MEVLPAHALAEPERVPPACDPTALSAWRGVGTRGLQVHLAVASLYWSVSPVMAWTVSFAVVIQVSRIVQSI